MTSLLEVLETRYESVDQVLRGLSDLEGSLYAEKDRRALFATAYLTMTREIAASVDQQRYNDPEWVADYAVAFANLYRSAFVAFDRGDLANVPDAWRISFGTSTKGSNLLLQDLLLGVNAHINHDLALALAEVSIDPNREARREDHFAVNEAIRTATNSVQDRVANLYAPIFRHLDRFLGRYDERVANFSIEKARLNAWTSAISLANAADEAERQEVRQSISDRSSVIAGLILAPTRRGILLKLRQLIERSISRWQLIRPGF